MYCIISYTHTIPFRELGAAWSCDELLLCLCWNRCSLLLWFSLHYCYVKITIFHPVVSKIKLRFYLKPGNREPMFECWDESGSEHPDMVPHRGVWSRGNTHRILWRQYFSVLLCTGSEDHSANLSQFLLAQRCVPPDCGVGDYPHVFLNQVIRDPCLGESCDWTSSHTVEAEFFDVFYACSFQALSKLIPSCLVRDCCTFFTRLGKRKSSSFSISCAWSLKICIFSLFDYYVKWKERLAVSAVSAKETIVFHLL